MTTNAEKVRKEYEEKLKAAEATDTLLKVVPFPERVSIHMHKLWNEAGSMRYGETLGIAASKSLAWEEAATVIKALPPVALCMVRDGCLSFRPQSHVDELEEKKKERWQEESPVAPVLVELDGFSGYFHIVLKWVATTPVGLMAVKVVVPRSESIVKVRSNSYTADTGNGERRRYYKHPSLVIGPDTYVVLDGETEVAQLETPIFWAAGSPENQGNVTLYFRAYRPDIDTATLGVQIVEHLARIA